MANNPRKFSEKIALHNQKQAEGTDEFEKILQEVKGAIQSTSPQGRLENQLNNGAEIQLNPQNQINQGQSSPSSHISLQQSHRLLVNSQSQLIQQQPFFQNENGQHHQNLIINQHQQLSNHHHLNPNTTLAGDCRTDTLPNTLTANEKSKSSIDLRSALTNLTEIQQGDLKKSNSRNRMPSPNHHLKTNSLIRHQQNRNSQQQPYAYNGNGSYDFNLNSQSNIPIQSTRSQNNLNNDHHVVYKSNHHNSHQNRTNPYLNPYLNIPEVNSWRRTNSDSALHQSTAMFCEPNQQLNQQQQQQQFYQQSQQQNQQNQLYDLQRQKVIIMQQEMKCDNQDTNGNLNNLNHASSWDPGKPMQQQTNLINNNVHNNQQTANNNSNNTQATIMYTNKNEQHTDLNNVTPLSGGAPPVISINYQQQTFSSINSNSTTNVQSMYTSSINQNVQCTQANYVNNQNNSNSTYVIQSQNGERPKSSGDNGQDNLNVFNQNGTFNQRQLTNQTSPNQNRPQLPTLQFQTSSQNNLNQLTDQPSTFNQTNSNTTNNNLDNNQTAHHSSALHINSQPNFLYANNNTCSGSLPDLSTFNHQVVVPLEQDVLNSGLNSNDNSNNSNHSNQSALSSGSYQLNNGFPTSTSISCTGSSMNYRSNNNNFIQYNCNSNNQNSSNSNSPLHQNSFQNIANNQQANQLNSQCVGGNQDNKFINQLTNNQLANQFHNHHISSPVRPSSVESTEDSGNIFNQLANNDILINEYENIEQFDFDLFSNQDNQNDKLISNDQNLNKINSNQDQNENSDPVNADTNNTNLANSFYQETEMMNHRVSTPSENASTAPNSPASSLHLNSPVNSPTSVNQMGTSIHIDSNLANMKINNDNEMNCKDNGISEDFMFDDFDSNKGNLDYLPSRDSNENMNFFGENNLNGKDQEIMANYNLINNGHTTTQTSIPSIIFSEHPNDELYPEI